MSSAWNRTGHFLKDHSKGIVAFLGVVLGIVVMVQNGHSVESHLLFWTINMPMVVWAVFFIIVGYLGGKGLEWCWNRRKRRMNRD